MPKEQFPDIVVPTISISTIYVGNSPKDIENLVTRPIEKQLKGISGAKVNKITSTSQADYSLIIVEFDTDVKTELAKQKVKDAIDKAQTDLPNDLTQLPNVQEFAFSEMPIWMFWWDSVGGRQIQNLAPKLISPKPALWVTPLVRWLMRSASMMGALTARVHRRLTR